MEGEVRQLVSFGATRQFVQEVVFALCEKEEEGGEKTARGKSKATACAGSKCPARKSARGLH